MGHRLLISLLALAIAGTSIARADEAKPSLIAAEDTGGKFTATVAFTTEYFARGVSNTRPGVGAVQSGLEFEHDSGFHLGAWGSNVDFPPPDNRANIELDYIGGYRGKLTGTATYDLFATYFTYPGAKRADGRTYDYWEFAAKADDDFGFAKPYMAVNYSPAYQFGSGYEWYVEGGAGVPLGRYFTGLLHVGHSIFDRNVRAESPDYWDTSAGIGTSVAGFDVRLEYVTNNLAKAYCVGACDRLVATVSKTFWHAPEDAGDAMLRL